MPRRTGFAGFAARRGSSAAMPARRPAQSATSGQMPQAGARGADGGAEVHQRLREVAGPRGRGQRRGERDEARLGGGKRRLDAKSRAITRSTLPSTTTARRPKAIAATAAAV